MQSPVPQQGGSCLQYPGLPGFEVMAFAEDRGAPGVIAESGVDRRSCAEEL